MLIWESIWLQVGGRGGTPLGLESAQSALVLSSRPAELREHSQKAVNCFSVESAGTYKGRRQYSIAASQHGALSDRQLGQHAQRVVISFSVGVAGNRTGRLQSSIAASQHGALSDPQLGQHAQRVVISFSVGVAGNRTLRKASILYCC